MSIDGGDVLRLAGNDYLVLGNAREGRFGIDDQPKFWVKSAIEKKDKLVERGVSIDSRDILGVPLTLSDQGRREEQGGVI